MIYPPLIVHARGSRFPRVAPSERAKRPIWKISLMFILFCCHGLSNNAVLWFRSYLTNRSIYTMVDNNRSSTMDVPIGVPQGSILGPLLFILFVNDLPHCLKSCNVVLYADDTVIYYSSSMISDVESKLNADLANITDWFNSNRLTLNFEK